MELTHKECENHLLPVRDALDILSGKWKIPIIIALEHGNRRFKEIERVIEGITPKMLSKELKELEMNKLVTRTVYDSIPVRVEYEATEYSHSLKTVIKALAEWGYEHRNIIMNRKEKPAPLPAVQACSELVD